MRIILDTNVLVSGIFFGGPPYKILKAWRDGSIELVVSNEILEEYFSVSEILSIEFPGIDIKVDDNQEVTLDLRVVINYGMNIPDAARQVQATIKSAVDKTLNINLKDINVNVQGIERGAR